MDWDYILCGLVQVWCPVWTRVTGVLCGQMYRLYVVYYYVVLNVLVRFHRGLLETHQPVCSIISHFRLVSTSLISDNFLIYM